MSDLLARMARTLSKRWGRGLIGAVVILFALFSIASLGGEPAPDDFSIPETDSQTAIDLLEAHSPVQAGVDSQVVFRAKTGKISDATNKAAVDKALAKIETLKGVDNAPSPFGANSQSVSKDGTIAFTTVQYTTDPDDIEKKDGTDLIDAAELANGPGVEASVRGTLAEYAAEQEAPIGELAGIVLAAILLVVLFRSFSAMGATILAALLGVMFGQALLAAVSKPLGLPEFAAFLAVLLGLGAGIDYALLIIGRYREQIAQGYSTRDAAAKAAATSGSAVVTAGLIVMVAI
ncbi:MAG: MMPL family transporter, partial [Solirubrobacteraceae bacterium]|nr:MMPL family transporter [Solirubrobacteraceae bacterium]